MTFNLSSLVRPNVLALEPYSSARSEFNGQAQVWLDANESPHNAPYNRYPDPLQKRVKEALAAIKGVPCDCIFLGNGSDEAIDLMYRVFCRPGVDNVVSISPSYGMYEVCANINDVEFRKVELDDDFGLQTEAMLAAADESTKVMWLCSPNNPTGNAFGVEQIKWLLTRFSGILVVDEAYGDFSSQPSMRHELANYPNLVVLNTFSKAWGSAGVRLGIAFASPQIVGLMNKVKYPYNVNALTQRYALERMGNIGEIEAQIADIMSERAYLIGQLEGLEQVIDTMPTDANFVLTRVTDADGIYAHLCRHGIVVRNRSRVAKCLGCLRITVGTREENDAVVAGIRSFKQET